MQFIQDFSEHRVYLALVITSAARGPGAESRAADRSPARRDAGDGSPSPVLQLIAITLQLLLRFFAILCPIAIPCN